MATVELRQRDPSVKPGPDQGCRSSCHASGSVTAPGTPLRRAIRKHRRRQVVVTRLPERGPRRRCAGARIAARSWGAQCRAGSRRELRTRRGVAVRGRRPRTSGGSGFGACRPAKRPRAWASLARSSLRRSVSCAMRSPVHSQSVPSVSCWIWRASRLPIRSWCTLEDACGLMGERSSGVFVLGASRALMRLLAISDLDHLCATPSTANRRPFTAPDCGRQCPRQGQGGVSRRIEVGRRSRLSQRLAGLAADHVAAGTLCAVRSRCGSRG